MEDNGSFAVMHLLAVIEKMGLFKSKNRPIKATNKSLNELFTDIDLIQIKRDGVHEDKALSSDIVLKIDEPSKIQAFKKMMAMIEPSEDFQCMCLGDYAIELHKGNELRSTIGFHHGVSIRFNKWTGDAELKYPDELLELLSELGLQAPLDQKKLDDERANESEEKSYQWLKNSPKSFSNYWNEINDFDESYIPDLKKDLRKEFGNEKQLILALLKSFGTSHNLWTAFPMYETIAQKLLNDYELQVILDAFMESSNDQTTIVGLGRYLFSWDFRKKIQEHKEKLNAELLELLLAAFQEINDSDGIKSTEFFLKTANNGEKS